MDIESAKDQIIAVAQALWEKNLNGGYGGNLSIRVKDTMLITPTGKPKHLVKPSEIAMIDIETRKILTGKPSSEYRMHLAIYRRLPNVTSILHAHPPFLMGYALAQKSPPTEYFPETAFLIGNVPVAEPLPSGSWDLANAVATTLEQNNASAVILANHGITIISNKDLWHAYFLLESLEHVAIAGVVAKTLRGDAL